MNTRSITLALFTATATFAFLGTAKAQDAQPATTAPTHTETYVEKMTRELSLTPEQVTKFEEIDARHRNSAKELNRANLPTAQMQERARVLRDRKDSEMKAMLTAEQWDKLMAMRTRKQDGHAERLHDMQSGHQE